MLRRKNAFTLLEQSLVIAILSIMTASGALYYSNSDFQTRHDETIRRISVVHNAIIAYYLKNSAAEAITNDIFPCPADPVLEQQHSNYGVATNNGTTCNLTSKKNNYFYGVVPVTTLGLPFFYGYDAWGNRLSYVLKYDNVADILTNWTDAAMVEKLYMIISHGENGFFAFTKSGAQRKSSNDNNEINNSINASNYNNISAYDQTATYDDIVFAATGSRFMTDLAGGVVPSESFCKLIKEKTYSDNACNMLKNKLLTLCPKQ